MTLYLQCSQEKKILKKAGWGDEEEKRSSAKSNGVFRPSAWMRCEAAAIGVSQPSILAGGIPEPASALL